MNWKTKPFSSRAAQAACRRHKVAHVSEGHADIFLTYCTNALVAQKENPDQQIVGLPDSLAVGADYGLTVIDEAPSAAHRYADFILSPDGQKILEKHGFTPGH
jgi:ABC-type molybdate transport system substrate-binding protein